MRGSGPTGRGGRPAFRPGAALLAAVLLLAAGLGLAAGAGAAQAAEVDTEICAACHGAVAARPEQPETPVLAGQTELYALYQLVYFRQGQRRNEIMNPLVADMSDDELRALAAWVATLPLPAAPQGAVDETLYARGEALARGHRCGTCHEPDLSGREHMPRLAGQQEDYLLKTLRDYKAGRRVGIQAAMAEVLSPLDDADLEALAHYMANAGR